MRLKSAENTVLVLNIKKKQNYELFGKTGKKGVAALRGFEPRFDG